MNAKYRTERHLPFWVFGVHLPTADNWGGCLSFDIPEAATLLVSHNEKAAPMAANESYAPSNDLINVMVHSSEKLEGAASLLTMLEEKADNQQITAAELSAVRCIVETCARDLDAALR